jgi:hypothetical protein
LAYGGDSNYCTASDSFTQTVGVTATQVIASKVLTVGQATASFTPVVGGAGVPPLTYSISRHPFRPA